MKANKLGLGVTGIMAIFLVMATAAYGCTVAAGASDHDFQVTPNSGSTVDVAVVGEGYCVVGIAGCSDTATSTTNDVKLQYLGPCAGLTGGSPCGTLSALAHSHPSGGGCDPPTGDLAGANAGRHTLTSQGGVGQVQRVLVANAVMPIATRNLGPGTYAVCATFEPHIMWNLFNVV